MGLDNPSSSKQFRSGYSTQRSAIGLYFYDTMISKGKQVPPAPAICWLRDHPGKLVSNTRNTVDDWTVNQVINV